MLDIKQEMAEQKIVKIIEEIRDTLEVDVSIDGNCSPGFFFKSQVLVTAIGRVAVALNVIIPDKCYIFFDKQKNKQLTIKEAAQKLIKEAKNGN